MGLVSLGANQRARAGQRQNTEILSYNDSQKTANRHDNRTALLRNTELDMKQRLPTTGWNLTGLNEDTLPHVELPCAGLLPFLTVPPVPWPRPLSPSFFVFFLLVTRCGSERNFFQFFHIYY